MANDTSSNNILADDAMYNTLSKEPLFKNTASNATFSNDAETYTIKNKCIKIKTKVDGSDLEPKTALVNGTATISNEGCVILRLLKKYYRVYVLVTDVEELERMHSLQKRFAGANYLDYSSVDLLDKDDITKKILDARRFLRGRINVLINNGGTVSPN